MRRFLLFCISGTLGFLVDTGVYYLAALTLPYYAARGLSFFIGVITTWLFNRNITFRGLKFNGSLFSEFLTYFTSMLAGGAVNYLSFVLCMKFWPLVVTYPVLGIAVGSIAGLFVNFTLSKLLIYRHKIGR